MEAENARLDALWQSTQAYADLLPAVGASPLIGSAAPTSAGQIEAGVPLFAVNRK
jgi:hypothetical protein